MKEIYRPYDSASVETNISDEITKSRIWFIYLAADKPANMLYSATIVVYTAYCIVLTVSVGKVLGCFGNPRVLARVTLSA